MEIAGGLGPTVEKVIRIGIMGYNATPQKIEELLRVLREAVKYAEYERSSKL